MYFNWSYKPNLKGVRRGVAGALRPGVTIWDLLLKAKNEMQHISLKLKFQNYEMWLFTVDFKRLVNPQASLLTLSSNSEG